MTYRANAPHVIAETIGGETIIVHLSTGCYFSLEGAAVDVWDGISAGHSVDAIVAELAARYDATPEHIDESVRRLLDELRSEELIVEGEAASSNGAPAAAAPASGVRAPFVEPAISKFTDMQDIILLDPVHEVDARGWPHEDPTRA
jgi:hypothetical protein